MMPAERLKMNMDAANNSSNEEDEEIIDAHFAPPPTRLTWIEGVAWLVAILLVLASGILLDDTWYGKVETLSLVVLTFYAIAHATGVVGIFYLLRTSRREKREPFQPGHWLLILMGVSAPFFVLSNVTQVVLFYDGFADTESYLRANTIAFALWHLVEWGLVLLLAFTLPVRSAWRIIPLIYFIGASLGIAETFAVYFQLFSTADQWYGYLSIQYFALTAIFLVGFAVWDKATTTAPRDWLHWLGIINELVFFAPTYIYWIQSLLDIDNSAAAS